MTNQIVIPSNPADQKIIKDAIIEADNSLLRIDAERDQIKAIVEDLSEKFPDIPKKYFKQLIRTYHKQNIDVVRAENEDLTALYETVVQ